MKLGFMAQNVNVGVQSEGRLMKAMGQEETHGRERFVICASMAV